jgi:FkbM family methyltransferase
VEAVPTRPYFYLGDDRGLTQLSGGHPFYVYTRDRSITPWILLGGTWETFVDNVLCALASPGDVFLDVGANQGYYTVKIGVRVGPTGRVFAFEPNPQIHRFLTDNIEVNALQQRVTPFALAAGATPGRAVMTVEANYPGGARVLLPENGEVATTPIDVEVVRIDDVIPVGVVANLIKIDVEGFEPLVARGMRGLLARSPDAAIVCEISVHEWRRVGDPLEILSEMAGDRLIFRIHEDGQLEEITGDLAAALNPSFVSYVLLLPNRPERLAQIRDFGRR